MRYKLLLTQRLLLLNKENETDKHTIQILFASNDKTQVITTALNLRTMNPQIKISVYDSISDKRIPV